MEQCGKPYVPGDAHGRVLVPSADFVKYDGAASRKKVFLKKVSAAMCFDTYLQVKTRVQQAIKTKPFICECGEGFAGRQYRQRHQVHCLKHLQCQVAIRTAKILK